MLLKILKLIMLLMGLLGVAYFIQSSFFVETGEMKLLRFSYLFNFAFSTLILINVMLFKKLLINFLGFIFLALGVVKIGVFYFLVTNAGFEKNQSTFLLFFVPFLICLGVEIFYLVRELNRSNFTNNN